MPPYRKSFKSYVVETIFFISLFALVGHLSVNFWERFVVQSELTQMKTSLNVLREKIHDICIAYNFLHKELQQLANIADVETKEKIVIPPQVNKAHSTGDLKLLQDMQVQTVTSKSKYLPKKRNRKIQHAAQENATTSYSNTNHFIQFNPAVPYYDEHIHEPDKKEEEVVTHDSLTKIQTKIPYDNTCKTVMIQKDDSKMSSGVTMKNKIKKDAATNQDDCVCNAGTPKSSWRQSHIKVPKQKYPKYGSNIHNPSRCNNPQCGWDKYYDYSKY